MVTKELKDRLATAAYAAVLGDVFDDLIDQAFKAGFDAGGNAMRDSILRAASSQASAEASRVDPESTEGLRVSAPLGDSIMVKEKAKRAPKGLTEKILHTVLTGNPGLEMHEVQDRAVEIDARVSPKTVYNELYRKNDLYVRDDRGAWSLRSVTLPLTEGAM